LAGFLLLLPLLWTRWPAISLTAGDVIYFFGVWLLLIAVAAAFAPGLRGGDRRRGGRGLRCPSTFWSRPAPLCGLPVRRGLHCRTPGAGGRLGWLRSPLIYTLSLSIYCTAWTFYGAVGYAARSGLEFLTIYFGPDAGLCRLVVAAAQAGADRAAIPGDLDCRPDLGAVRQVEHAGGDRHADRGGGGDALYRACNCNPSCCPSGSLPAAGPDGQAPPMPGSTAIWVAVGLALFTILFGTRNLDAKEQHHGIVTAIAVEAVVKLVALLAVGSLRGLGHCRRGG
jgi:hypothetical protein